jgi:glycosyltransferase involved in cell wall biosynthesis
MKIVINAVSAKMGGAVTYLTNVLRRLPPPESGDDFVVYLPPETAAKQQGLRENVRLAPTTIGHAAWWKRIWWEQVTLRRCLRSEHVDALFSSANFGMFRCPVRQLLLVRIPLYFSRPYLETFLPQHPFKTRMAFKLRRWLCCRSARAADVVMTPTQAMLDELMDFVEVEAPKRLVNFYGAAPPPPPQPSLGSVPPDLPAVGPRVIRLTYVSLYSEHKNLSTLLKAMPLLNRNGAPRFVLSTTADPAWQGGSWTVTHDEDMALARRPEVAACVEFVGPLGSQQVQDLLRRTDLVVFPALTESFGHPMVEAMAHGLPIVASDTPVNREICGEAAVYFRLLDPSDLAEKVRNLCADEGLRQRLSESGRARAAHNFKWEDHVARLLAALAVHSN